ncbi:membrane protein [Acetobacter indonesiensis]|uniref:PACE efflux transporter n=1 Tax=Acetobacter indonesiensis TaxID=104101 RepID=UPI000B731A89|nr:PACE efflux transporter [Acetobacter indonesiensis]OUI93137.1 membrane protein [Acetobacter indonesiensis]
MSTHDPALPPMRSPADRVRHALLFECLALLLVIPVGAQLFGLREDAMGVIGIGSAIAAMIWNYLYNLGFDYSLSRLTGSVHKTLSIRVVHTLLFEAGLQVVLLPAIAWYLHTTIRQAFSLSFSLALFYLVYAFFFNIAYDAIFPVNRNRETEVPTV